MEYKFYGLETATIKPINNKVFGDALRNAAKKGAHIFGYECGVKLNSLEILRPVPIKLKGI